MQEPYYQYKDSSLRVDSVQSPGNPVTGPFAALFKIRVNAVAGISICFYQYDRADKKGFYLYLNPSFDGKLGLGIGDGTTNRTLLSGAHVSKGVDVYCAVSYNHPTATFYIGGKRSYATNAGGNISFGGGHYYPMYYDNALVDIRLYYCYVFNSLLDSYVKFAFSNRLFDIKTMRNHPSLVAAIYPDHASDLVQSHALDSVSYSNTGSVRSVSSLPDLDDLGDY